MNKVLLLGRLTKDIDLRYGNSGKAFASFNLAVNRKYKKENGERTADFISCKVFDKTAEFMSKYMEKGSQITLEGRMQTGKYDKDGQTIYTTDVIVDSVYFADSKRATNEDDGLPL
jgi:single-strand DNA-binding protein